MSRDYTAGLQSTIPEEKRQMAMQALALEDNNAYFWLDDVTSQLDGWFTAEELRKIADGMDVLAGKGEYPLEFLPEKPDPALIREARESLAKARAGLDHIVETIKAAGGSTLAVQLIRVQSNLKSGESAVVELDHRQQGLY